MREASGLDGAYDLAMGTSPDPERKLAAPAGVARRVEELYAAHVRLVRSVCRSLLRDREEAEDAVQQTFLSAQRALANGSSPREPAAWLAVIARNECLARVRERMREPLPIDAESTAVGVDVHSLAVSRFEVSTLREALADLPRAQREAVLLRELRGLSYDEVARTLAVTTGAVESLIFRARRTLQRRLSEALPALSPVALLSRLLGGSDVAAPVAKVAAIGVGAAILAGGAVYGPHTFGSGHATAKAKAEHVAPPRRVRAAPYFGASPPALVRSAPPPKHVETQRTERETRDAKDVSSSDAVEISAPEKEPTETESESAPASTTPSTPAKPARDDSGTSHDSGSDDPPGDN